MLRRYLIEELATQTHWSKKDWEVTLNTVDDIVGHITSDVEAGIRNFALRMGASPTDVIDLVRILSRRQDAET